MTKNKAWLIWALFIRLRRYKFPLGPEDYESLRLAMRAGFGWNSLDDLRKLCASLWAKSLQEQEVVFALFDQLIEQSDIEYSWTLDEAIDISENYQKQGSEQIIDETPNNKNAIEQFSFELENKQGLPPVYVGQDDIPRRPLVFLPQHPLSYREVAQAFRRLRKPTRKGPKVVLDVNATIQARIRSGVISPPIMIPHRINTFKLVLLVDRYGSMLPFHNFIELVVLSIIQSAKLENVSTYYFHDIPVVGGDYSLLQSHIDQLMPSLDDVLFEIQPTYKGQIYKNDDLLDPIDVRDILKNIVSGTLVVIISDAGAARRNYDPARLLDTISFIKALREYTQDYVWLNPAGKQYWKNTTAEQIARHVPMFTLDAPGMYQAVNTLRGQPYFVEKAL